MNNNNCSFSDIGNLTQPARMTANLSDVSPTCSGVEDGSLQINNVDGGTMPYNFNWSNGVNDATNPNIASGKYIYTITDNGGCEVIDSINLMAETEIIIDNPIISPVQCFGFDNGSISVSSGSSGLQPPAGNFVFVWSNNATDVNSTTNTSFADNLGPDTYTLILTYTGLPGCEATQDFTITEPDSLKIEIDNILNVSSCPLSDGAATLRVEGGTIATDYSYIWEDGQSLVYWQTNLAADTFKVIVTDDNACIDSLDVIVGTPPPPVIQFFEDDSVSCASDEGFLSVNAVRGEAPIPTNGYTWSHDPFITTSIAGALAPGVYFVTVTDDDQCSTIDSAIVFSPPPLNIDTTIFVNPCFEAEDGRISVSISGGTPNATGQFYTFSWPNGATGSVLPNVVAGTYNLSVTDANNCELTSPLTLDNLPRIMVAFDPASITGVDCFDNMNPADCDGTASAIATYEDGTIGIFDFTWATGEIVSGTDQNCFQ